MRSTSAGLEVAALVVSSALLVSACGRPATPTVATTPSATAVASGPAAGPTSGPPSTPASPFDRAATPPTTSGPLGASTMPKASALGPGWTAYLDSGSAEDGYTGNGTPVVARDVRDVADAMLPFGCLDAAYVAPMPVAVHALEANYRHTSGKHAVGTALDFGTPAAAAAFLAAYEKALTACVAGAGATTVVMIEEPPVPGAFVTVQTDRAEGTVYRELLVPAGRMVRILDVEGATTPVVSWAALAAAFPPACCATG